jgi:hypothetical protein
MSEQKRDSNCEECADAPSTLWCAICEQFLCPPCAAIIHKGGSRKNHQLTPLFPSLQENVTPVAPSTQLNDPKIVNTSAPELISANPVKVGVYWDVCQPSENSKEIRETVLFLKSRYGSGAVIKVYMKENKPKLGFNAESFPAIVRIRRDFNEIGLVLSDVSQDALSLVRQVLITNRGHLFKSHLQMISSSMLTCNITVLTSPVSEYEMTADQIPALPIQRLSVRSHRETTENDREVYKLCRRKAAASESNLETSMVGFIKDQAYQGFIMHEFNELCEKLGKSLGISRNYAGDLIKTGCKLGKLHQQTKNIGIEEVRVISLKVEKLSNEVLLWVLRSLRNDEMISTEKAIQSRLKEAFDLKIPQQLWTSFIDTSMKSKRIRHKKSLSDSENFSYFSKANSLSTPNFYFGIKKVQDFGTGTENLAIYPVNEEWVSYDQYIKSGDVFLIKQTADWEAFIQFFELIFNVENPEEQAISGGRYGCAQYVKHFSPALRNCSLGKLSYMIQLAIDEDLLRYHKTLLVWVPIFDKRTKKDRDYLYQTKRKIVSALGQCGEGISLAQLPTVLRDVMKAEIDLSKIGFAKLKDLVASIPDLELLSKGKNHPFVRVRKPAILSADSLGSFIHKILTRKNLLSLSHLEYKVSEEFGYNWTVAKYKDLEDFVRKSAEFNLNERGMVEKRSRDEICHSYSSSTNGDAYSHSNCGDSVNGDEGWKRKEVEEINIRFIEELVDEEDMLSAGVVVK